MKEELDILNLTDNQIVLKSIQSILEVASKKTVKLMIKDPSYRTLYYLIQKSLIEIDKEFQQTD